MPIDILLKLFASLHFVFKLFLVIILILHLIFSLLLVQQTRLMNKVTQAGISPVIMTVTVIHLLASASIFIGILVFF